MRITRVLPSIALLASAALILSACAPETEEPTPDEPPVTETVSTDADYVNGLWVQDLWIYESVRTITSTGEELELLGDILAELTVPSQSVELPFEGLFHVHDSLKPTVTHADGSPRLDVDVVAGVLEHDGGRGLAVLGTPASDADAPIGLDDLVEVDLTFLGDALQPGDPLLLDFSFLQARPAADEVEATGLDLLANRIADGRAFTYGEDVDGEQTVFAFTSVLGTAVEGSTRMSGPGKDKISKPGLDGIRDGLRKCLRSFGLKCVRGYHKSAAGGFEDSMNLIDCNLRGGSCTPPLPPPPPPGGSEPYPWCGLGCVPPRVSGDPHILSFDGLGHDMQGVGEYVLTSGPDLEVHIRTKPVSPSVTTVSSVAMAAVKIGGHTIVVDSFEHRARARVDGEVVPHDRDSAGVTQAEFDDVSVLIDSGSVMISAPEQEIGVVVSSFGERFNVSIYVAEGAGFTGLLGDRDGDPTNDVRTRDGTVLPTGATKVAYYADFANSWRVSQDESLLHYEAGETTETFTDLAFPSAPDAAPSASALARAEALCVAAGVTDAGLIAECAFDYAMSGDIAFVESAQILSSLSERVLWMSGAATRGGADGDAALSDSQSTSPWSFTMTAYEVADRVRHECPARGSLHTVWGGANGVYTDDSSVCSAAVHAGLITIQRGGIVVATKTPGLDSYGDGSERNGVTTRGWGSWPGSFMLEQEP